MGKNYEKNLRCKFVHRFSRFLPKRVSFSDQTKPDGTPKKLMDSSELIKKGWTSTIELEKGIKLLYEWFLNNIDSLKELRYNQN